MADSLPTFKVINFKRPIVFKPLLILFFQIKDQATSGFQAFIVHYRDDPDQQNLIDWIQERWVGVRYLRLIK
jgi:hypothetical protein